MIWVKCIGIDDKGRVKLSRKAALKERGEIETGAPVSEEADGGTGEDRRGEYRRHDGGAGRRDRGERRGRGREREPREPRPSGGSDEGPSGGQGQSQPEDYEP